MPDWTALLGEIVIPTVSSVLAFLVGLFVGRKLDQKDRRRQDDRVRIYEPLHVEVSKLLASEEGSRRGSVLNTPEVRVLDDLEEKGLLVPPRHHCLRTDVEKLRSLSSAYQQRSYDFNVVLNATFGREGELRHFDELKSDTALFNAVVGLSKEAFVARYTELLRAKHISGPETVSWSEDAFGRVSVAVDLNRAALRTATEDLLGHGKAMKAALETALQRGKYRRDP